MDFEKLLRVARKNELNKKEPIKCLQTKFKPPTKEQHERDKVLSEGVQRFLARKEEEERKKQMEAERRKQELLALRAKDPKANKRIQTMLKRTKSANKSVMEDAVDNDNTADTLAGPSQPDEDDYGFVSESSSQLYDKLIQKMYRTPSDNLPKFAPSRKPNPSGLSNTKERVKMALLRQEEEEKLPHRRKRKGKEKKEEEEDNVDLKYSAPDRNLSSFATDHSRERTEKPKVKRPPPPPPVDFHELLKIAEQKQHEPIIIEPKKPLEPEVLMTKKQKIEHEKVQEWKRQRELRLLSLEKREKCPAQEDKKPVPKTPKLSLSSSDQKSPSQKKVNGWDSSKMKAQDKSPSPAKRGDKIAKPVQGGPSHHERTVGTQEKKFADEETSRLLKERNEALRILKEKEKLIRERDEAVRKLKEKQQLIKERDEAVRKLKLLEESERMRNSSKTTEVSNSKCGPQAQKLKTVVKDSGTVKSCPEESASPKTNPGIKKLASIKNGMRSETKNVAKGSYEIREFPPRDLNHLAKGCDPGRGPNVERRKQFPPADVRRKALAAKRLVKQISGRPNLMYEAKKRTKLKLGRIESDDEYDSELDDFIDDDDNEVPSEVSKVISEIFHYDKNKYSRYDDAEDECMESNFAQISKEEFFSTKCGILEDLKDIQREKAKLAKKKKR